MSDFTVVPNEIRERLKKKDSIVAHLVAGDTVFLPEKLNGGGWSTYMRHRYQQRLVSRTAVVDGVKGVVIWTEPIEDGS
jgi:hypothetical protein